MVKEANSWAKSATRGSIQDILKPEDINSDDTMLVLANALYFKGVWPIEEKFNKENTKEGKFFLLNGDEVLVPFMSKRINHASSSYGTFDGFDVLKLKYANREFSMYFFLPNKKDGLQDLLNEFKTSPKTLDSNLYAAEIVEVRIPKFKFEYSVTGASTMKDMGLTLPFNPNCMDFDKMVEQNYDDLPIYISDIVQKAYIEVNEELPDILIAVLGPVAHVLVLQELHILWQIILSCS